VVLDGGLAAGLGGDVHDRRLAGDELVKVIRNVMKLLRADDEIDCRRF